MILLLHYQEINLIVIKITAFKYFKDNSVD